MLGLQRFVLISLAAFLVSLCGCQVSAATQETRIVGGVVTNIEKLPYIVQLRTKADEQFCGATLVAPRYVITAAHCFGSFKIDDVTVVGGANTRKDAGVRRRIIRLQRHPEYTSDNYHSDIVVLKLDADMVGKNIKPIPLCSKALRTGDILQISGWGQTGTHADMSLYLRTITAPTISKETCRQTWGRFVEKNMICAHVPGTKDSCGGDSGGPAVHNGELCGVVAFGSECASKTVAGAYTDVYAVRSFLQNAMRS